LFLKERKKENEMKKQRIKDNKRKKAEKMNQETGWKKNATQIAAGQPMRRWCGYPAGHPSA
jgi:hypothetical protein